MTSDKCVIAERGGRPGGRPIGRHRQLRLCREDQHGGGACTGVLVSPTWVMTAADCFPGSSQGGAPASATTVTVGRTDLTTTAGHVAHVVNLVPRTDRDLMLAELDTPISDITPAAVSTTAPATGEVLRVAGYGRTEADWVPNLLHTNTFSVTATAPTTIALTGANGSDTCKGDAGGPAIREVDGKTELAGISSTSWQHGCLAVTQTRQGSTETRVDDLATWLRPMLACGGDGPAAGIPVPPAGSVPRWYGWDSPDGTIVGAPAVTSSAKGRIDLFAKGPAGDVLYHSTYQNGAWSTPESLGDGLASDPAVVSWAPGRFDVFARGYDNSVQHKWFDGVWHDWESLGGTIQYAPAVASWAPGRLDVFVIGGGNALYHKAFDGSGWHDWKFTAAFSARARPRCHGVSTGSTFLPVARTTACTTWRGMAPGATGNGAAEP